MLDFESSRSTLGNLITDLPQDLSEDTAKMQADTPIEDQSTAKLGEDLFSLNDQKINTPDKKDGVIIEDLDIEILKAIGK